jgi:hypothetical protein
MDDRQRRPAFVHPENGRKCLLGVIQRTIAVVENADAVPELGIFLKEASDQPKKGRKMASDLIYFRTRKHVKGLLVGRICFLQVILHQVTMT